MKMAENSHKWVENDVGREEIAVFSLSYLQCFQKSSTGDTLKNRGLFVKRLNLVEKEKF